MDRKAPHIAIDGYNLALERGTGVATYGNNLLQAARGIGCTVDGIYGVSTGDTKIPLLREIGLIDPLTRRDNKVKVFVRRVRHAIGTAVPKPIDRTGQVVMDTTLRRRFPRFDTLWNYPDLWRVADTRFNLLRSRFGVRLPQNVDVAHWTYPLPVKATSAANLYTLHDLVPLRLPYTTLDNKRKYYRLMRMLCRTADHIVTVSETSRRDIIDLFGVEERRITNTYQAVDLPPELMAKPESEVEREISGIFGLDYKNYFLFYGAIEPKKNVGRLIQGYMIATSKHARTPSPRYIKAPLVLVGSRAWKSDQELRLLDTAGASNVRMIEYSPFPLLVSLIRGARAVVFPSIYEGFGLPILEAMMVGTPVITAGIGSMKEIAGDAAHFIDPYDVGSIARAIQDVDGSADLRESLTHAGYERAELFSMAAYQRRLTDLWASL